ncbi:MAG: DUF5103 domain-containing protein [Bacteroidia bacterium]|nr:DUF5103 domain-containing protein [Bacteroidia bacterium]
MRFLVLTILLLLPSFLSQGQPTSGYIAEDDVYVDYVKSIKFHIVGLPLSMPIIDLSSSSFLEFSFDDLSDNVNDYSYTIIHCDSDWQPSNLNEMEYIDGFTEADIENYEFGYNTFTPFTHYNLYLPNEDLRFTKSGNYVLLVYDDDTDAPIITRRFCVVEPQMSINSIMTPTSNVSKSRTHQELDFTVIHRGINVRNPQSEIKATVVQNGNWQTAKTGLSPLFTRPEEMRFDYQDKIVFPALNEYRNLDLRSFQYRTENVLEIQDEGRSYNIILKLDGKREFEPYSFIKDLNGGFVIENNHFDDFDLESDYGNIVFTLDCIRPFRNAEVYIVGGMTDWKLREENRMTFNETYYAYMGDIFLKQGFYNYLYAVVDKTTGHIAYKNTEGSWFNTENNYTILVYYRPFGERYDRLVAVSTINSFQN